MDVRKWVERQVRKGLDKYWGEACQTPFPPITEIIAVADEITPVITKLAKQILLDATRLSICADRMRGCNGEHELVDEVDAWEAEARDALAELEKPGHDIDYFAGHVSDCRACAQLAANRDKVRDNNK